MADEGKNRFNIIFLGPIKNDLEHVTALAKGLRSRFGLSEEGITQLMRMAPVVIKKGLTQAEAQIYKDALEDIGARVSVEEIAEEGEVVIAEENTVPPQEVPAAGGEIPPLEREAQVIPMKGGSDTTESQPEQEQEKAETITCPQCGFVQPKTDECIRCGVIISKFLKYMQQVRPVGTEPNPSNPETDTSITLNVEVQTTSESGPLTPSWEGAGFLSSVLRTIKEVLTNPSPFFRSIPSNRGMTHPLLFAVIVTFFGTTIALLEQYAFATLRGGISGLEGFDPFQTAFLILYVFSLPVLICIGIFIMSGIFQLCLMLVGDGKGGYEATFTVVCYASGAQVLAIIPFIGSFIVGIYQLVLGTIGFRERHGTTTGKALLAILLPMIVLALIGIAVALSIPMLLLHGNTILEQPPQYY